MTDEIGRRFRIGTGFSNKERRNPPAVGTVITYKFTGTKKERAAKIYQFFTYISAVLKNLKAQLKKLELEHECSILK